MLALPAGTNFEVGDFLVVDVGGQKQFEWIVSNCAAVGKLDDSQPFVKHFEGGFLASAGQYMTENEHWLSLTFCAKVSQGVLGDRCA